MKKSALFLLLSFVFFSGYAQNVGIGTITPVYKLDVVNGAINTTEDYKIKGATIIGIQGTSNLRIGHLVGLNLMTGADNTLGGFQAGYFLTAGFDNSFFGSSAGYFTYGGSGNSFFGAYSGYLNSSGGSNSFFGTSAGTNNNTGSANSFFGKSAGYSNTTGQINTAVGFNALYTGNGTGNTAVGYQALFRNTTGNGNTATGAAAMDNITTGVNNTAHGYQALGSISTTNDNAAFGAWASVSSGQSNSTVLGHNTMATGSNQVRLGDFLVTSIGGYANWTMVSDGRFKKNIQQNVPGLDFIQKLNPVTYTLDLYGVENFLFPGNSRYAGIDSKQKEKLIASQQNGMKAKEKITYTGFIAQEVEASARLMGFNFSGVDVPQNDKDLYGLRYAEFVVPLVKAVQEQQTMIESQKLEIVELKLNKVKLEQQGLTITKQQKIIDELMVRIQKVEMQLQPMK